MRAHLATLTLLACLTAASAEAQVTPSDVRDLIGARGSSGESELAARGYINVGGRQGDGASQTYWWNDQRGVCLSVTTRQGRYDSLVSTPAADCRQGGGGPKPGERPPFDRPAAGEPLPYGPPQTGGPPGSGEEHITLVCYGEGRRPTLETRNGYEWDNDKDHYVPKSRTELSSQAFDGTVMLEVYGNTGRIRPAKAMIPPINSGGDDGWWPLAGVNVARDQITAQFRFSGLNKPRVTVDRRAGRISIESGGALAGFRGTCELVDARDHRRF